MNNCHILTVSQILESHLKITLDNSFNQIFLNIFFLFKQNSVICNAYDVLMCCTGVDVDI
jgi:hypothetical protein